MRCLNNKENIDRIKYQFYVFDTETTCLEPMAKNFVFGCMYGYNMRRVFYTVDEFIEEISKSKYKNKFIFAHNAEFDLLTIFGNIFLKVDTAAIFNGKFISAKYKEITFADSMNIFPTSVEKLGELVGLKKIENKKVREGRLNKNNLTQEDIDYCMRDCEIVFKSLLKIFELTGTIRITLPSLAMYDFRHNYLEHDLQFSDLVDEFYESYYGGRTEAFYIGDCNAKVYDVNSLYPAIMRTVQFPDVKHLKKSCNCDVKFLLHCVKYYEGMADVLLIHKETFFGYIPTRRELNGSTKLVFPVGEFRTTVNFNELRFAIEQGVVKIKKVYKVIYGNPIKSLFTEYIDDNYRRRLEASSLLESTIYKLKMNSLYGRFAMRMKLNTRYYEQIPFNLITMLKEAEQYCDVKLFNATRADCFLVTENEKFKNSFFSIPTLSSYITSEARVFLLKNLLANEKENVVYCDTDSIFVTGAFQSSVSDKLGDFKLENKIVSKIRGLKNYVYIDENGKENIVIKGVSRGSTQTKANTLGEAIYESQRYIKTKAALRQNKEAGTAYTMIKTITNRYDKREVFNDGTTRPLKSVDKGEFYIFINATKFIRPRQSKKKEKTRLRYTPQNIREAVMMFFVQGGKVATEDMRAHVTGKSNEELKHYFGLYEKNGQAMDTFCDNVPEEYYTDRIIDVFQDVLLSFNTVTKMREYLKERAEELENYEAERKKALVKEYEFDYDTPF
ncbi:MAG: hypothetical protein GYA62_05215 [Bacteroidales bacterium]|nr:hypothetical protein [Bacteroidales bacterium]